MTADKMVVTLDIKLTYLRPLTVKSGVIRARGKVMTLTSPAAEDAVEALLAIGYRESQVKGVVAELALGDAEATAEALIRKALSRLR